MRTGPPPRRQQIVLIVFFLVVLGAIVAFRDACAGGISKMFEGFDVPRARDGSA